VETHRQRNKEIEVIVQNGVMEGKSVENMQRSVKQYLNEPNKLFWAVRNKDTGDLELSEAVKKCHPRQGIYKNAICGRAGVRSAAAK
jgi:hypothetical protein